MTEIYRYPLVVQVGTLADFCIEIPAPARLRLLLSEKPGTMGGKFPVPTVTTSLDLYGFTPESEIIWLHQDHLGHKFGDTWGHPHQRQVYELYPQIKAIVSDWLIERGYDVRSGKYALPADIQPIRGFFECVSFEVNDEDEVILRRSA